MNRRLPALLSAALLAGGCAAPAAEMPALPEPRALAGSWTLAVEGAAPCRLRLDAQAAPNGYRAAPLSACAAPVRQWRPVPDGIELAGEDGLTLILLEPAGRGAYAGRDAAGRTARLSR